MHENMSFEYINRIVKPRSTSEAILVPNPSIQPPKLRFSFCIDGHGPYSCPLMASSVILSLLRHFEVKKLVLMFATMGVHLYIPIYFFSP